jgi:NAD(P)-dependent dehydrogenase (short-subunit alcohol dehydrogenase family)
VEIADRTLFVTGGARGIGLGTAKAFARQGARVVITDIDENALEEARRQLGQIGPARAYMLDVRDRAAFASTVEEAERELGEIDILFNNAGVAGGAHVKRMTYEYWDWVMGINTGGVINGIQTVVPGMLRRGRGYVINTASGAGLVAVKSSLMYSTSKSAVVGLSEALAMDLEPYGIGVSVLCPGFVATDILRSTRQTRPVSTASPAENTAEEKAVHETDVMQKADRLSKGVSPDHVGELVLKGVLKGQTHIFTDTILRRLILERNERILEALEVAAAS